MAIEGEGFKSSYFSALAEIEEGNFWFVSRNRLILWAINKYGNQFRQFLEIGCGTGYVLNGIAREFPSVVLYGSEIFAAGLDVAASRVPNANFIQMDARKIPYQAQFDAIGAFDVLEHIEEDALVLRQIHAALNTNGLLFVTVPQHQWLWSATDDYACHVRRYAARDLHLKIKAAGFQIIRSTSFVSLLLPAMAISRLFDKRASQQSESATTELVLSPRLNGLFKIILRIELALTKMGLNFPLGGSRLVIARKQLRA